MLSVAMGCVLWPYVRPPSKDPQEGPPLSAYPPPYEVPCI